MKKTKWILSGIVAGVLGHAITQPFRYTVSRYTIKHTNIPKAFRGYRIIFLADVHYGRATQSRYLRKIIRRVNELDADLILLGGDYITERKYIEPCFKHLSHLKAKDGLFGVLGNHDVSESLNESTYCMERAGITLLTNKAVWIEREGDHIKVGGVGDYHTQIQDIRPTIKDLTDKDYSILMTHNPSYIHHIRKNENIGLVVGGHTHGAQFSSIRYLEKILPAEWVTKIGLDYISGLYHKGKTDIIVSNGVGTAKFPFRFFTPPEIVVIDLDKEHASK